MWVVNISWLLWSWVVCLLIWIVMVRFACYFGWLLVGLGWCLGCLVWWSVWLIGLVVWMLFLLGCLFVWLLWCCVIVGCCYLVELFTGLVTLLLIVWLYCLFCGLVLCLLFSVTCLCLFGFTCFWVFSDLSLLWIWRWAVFDCWFLCWLLLMRVCLFLWIVCCFCFCLWLCGWACVIMIWLLFCIYGYY